MQLEGRTVLVSGGASGLGAATAEMIVAAGGRVVIADIGESTGRAHAQQLGSAAEFVRTDVTSSDDVQRCVKSAVQRFGAIHGVVCAAGVGTAERVLRKEGVAMLVAAVAAGFVGSSAVACADPVAVASACVVAPSTVAVACCGTSVDVADVARSQARMKITDPTSRLIRVWIAMLSGNWAMAA